MKIEILRVVLPVVVGVIVPLFFLMVYVSSCLNRLGLLRTGCRARSAALLELLRGRQALAMKAVERSRQEGVATREVTRLETAVSALSSLCGDPGSGPGSEGVTRSLGAAARELEQALVRLATAPTEPPAQPAGTLLADLIPELDSNHAAVRSAADAYNQAVGLYVEARGRFPVRLVAGICGFVPLQNFAVDSG